MEQKKWVLAGFAIFAVLLFILEQFYFGYINTGKTFLNAGNVNNPRVITTENGNAEFDATLRYYESYLISNKQLTQEDINRIKKTSDLELKTREGISERQKDTLRRSMETALQSREKVFNNIADQGREGQREALRDMHDRLTVKYENEADNMRELREEELIPLKRELEITKKSKWADAKEAKYINTRSLEKKDKLFAQERLENQRDVSRATERERKQFTKSIGDIVGKYQKSLDEYEEQRNDRHAKLEKDVNARVDIQIKALQALRP